ncbi:zinc ribbon domain-containing protein [Pseudomonas viridiflava]|uniref:zinc ribbon domain-containing protein n=1 Tax=Pseudomonas viridiflava TaxID=33069 RepID=UPI001F07980C|nr:zinc ribbon domain-containing protein [Pseudomonas viridiflava]
MDVSVASGLGRVNNLGLMSERQNFTIVAGFIALGGLLMILMGGKSATAGGASAVNAESRNCPFCAEPIKKAAVKCKHCGSDVEPTWNSASGIPVALNAKGGWTVRYDCGSDTEMDSVKNRIAEMPGVILPDDGMTVVSGFFRDKEDAKEFRNRYSMKNGADGDLYFQPAPLF